LRGLFVTGTDTGVGKTVVAAAIAAALAAQGERVRALKPVITGLQESPHPDWPHDHVLLARAAGALADEVFLRGFAPPVSPHLAAEQADQELSLASLEREIRAAAPADGVLVVEGVGGLLVPLSETADVRDLARALDLPLVIAARPGLGTINHTRLTLEAAGAAGLAVRGVVLTPWPTHPDAIMRSNRSTLERLGGGVPVVTLSQLPRPEPALLARAGADLPLSQWMTEPYSS